MSLVDRDRAVVWHPYTQMKSRPELLAIARGEGVYLYTEDGRRVLDGISSWWVNIHGHAHPRLNQALADQAERIEHVIFAGATHQPAVDLAERLVGALPPGLTRVFYSDDGSTAVEVAIKLAVQYWRNRGHANRQRIVTMHHAYHGDTAGAMSLSEDSVFTRAFAPLMFPVYRVQPPYCYRCPLGLRRETCHIDCLSDLEHTLDDRGHSVAAVLVEPMLQGAGGMIMWPAEFLAGVRRLCDRHGVLLIADEVLTGFGRTGRMFACEHGPVTPDIICLSKALTAGYLPLAVTAVTGDIYDAFLSDDHSKTFFHGHSFTANPLACAVAVASFDLFKEHDILARIARLEAQLRQRRQSFAQLPIVGDVRVLGGVGAVELVSDKATKTAGGYLDQIGRGLSSAFLERGLLLRPLGNVLYFMPPYVITDDEVDWVIAQIGDVLKKSGG